MCHRFAAEPSSELEYDPEQLTRMLAQLRELDIAVLPVGAVFRTRVCGAC